ncbi:hypothetical protein WT13_08370 [Burkholderia anthina]|nr:hypothetical protein WT13_08370 [Burkholderia anthina]WJN74499.1 Two-component response regulator [Burkholderia anthina]
MISPRLSISTSGLYGTSRGGTSWRSPVIENTPDTLARRRDLGIAPRTVNKHLEHLFRELHVETRAGAAAAALKMLERT